MLRRNWARARAKVEAEAKCRVCKSTANRLEAAHTISRMHDHPADGSIVFVDPDDIVPLCQDCHGAYDARKLSLLEYLNHTEQASGVRHVGIIAAYRRFTSSRDGIE